MPSFRDPDGSVWVWDSTSQSMVKKPSAGLEQDRGHSTGGDNDLFNQNQLEHSEQEGVPELEGHMASWYETPEMAKPNTAQPMGSPRDQQVTCPLCQVPSGDLECPECGKDLTPEWNKKNDEYVYNDPAPQQHHLDGMPEREPKRNRMKTDDSYPSMNLSSVRACPQCGGPMESGSVGERCQRCGLELGHHLATFDEWDIDEPANTPSEIGKWIQDKQGNMHFEHGVHAVHPQLAERNGLHYPNDVGALGSVYNDGSADTQRVFPGHNFDHEGTQQQIHQAFGTNVTLQPPIQAPDQAEEEQQKTFAPIEISGGSYIAVRQIVTGVAWVKEQGGQPHPGAILVAQHTQNEDAPLWDSGQIRAVVTATGGTGSHAAILARQKNFPTVVGIGQEYTKIKTGNYLKIDPTTQTITVMPGVTADWSPDEKRDAWNNIMQYQQQRGGNVKPEYFAHIDEELAWHMANDASLDSCPECHSPMVKQASEQVCHTCGHKQPIIMATAGVNISVSKQPLLYKHKQGAWARALIVLASIGETPIGRLVAEPYEGGYRTDFIEVLPEYRRQGIAKLLVAEGRMHGLVNYTDDPDQIYQSAEGYALAHSQHGASVKTAGPALLAVPELLAGGAEVGAAGAAAGGGAGMGGLMTKALQGGAFQAGKGLVPGGGGAPGAAPSAPGAPATAPDADQVGLVSKTVEGGPKFDYFKDRVQDTAKGIGQGAAELVDGMGGAYAQGRDALRDNLGMWPDCPQCGEKLKPFGDHSGYETCQCGYDAMPIDRPTHALGDDSGYRNGDQYHEYNFDPEFGDSQRGYKRNAGAFGEEEDGWATKNDGTNSTDEASNSGTAGKKEQGDGPEQLKDIDGIGGPKSSDGTDAEKGDLAQADPEMQDKAMKAFHLNLPLVLEFANSDEAGADNPILRALDELLEEAFPGYKDGHDQQDGAQDDLSHLEIELGDDDSDEASDDDGQKANEKSDKEKGDEAKAASVWHALGNDHYEEMAAMQRAEGRDWENEEDDECPTCHGAGEVGAGFEPQFNHKCIHCKGTGLKAKTAIANPVKPIWDAFDKHLPATMVDECACGRYKHKDDETCDKCKKNKSASTKESFGYPTDPAQMNPLQPNGLMAQPGVGQNPTCPVCGQSHLAGTPCPDVSMQSPGGQNMQQPGTSGPITPPQPTKIITHEKLANWIAESDYHSDMDMPGATCPACGGPGVETSEGPQCRQCGIMFGHDQAQAADGLRAVPDLDQLAGTATDVGGYGDVGVRGPVYESSVDHEFAFYGANEDHVQPDGVGASQQPHHLHHPDHNGQEWVDDQGAPLQEGQAYEMKTGQSAIPDRVTLERVLPDKITYTVDSGDVTYRHELTKQQVDTDGTTFTSAAPADQIVDSADGFQDAPPRPGMDGAPQQDDLSVPSTHASSVSDSEHEIVGLDNYTGSYAGDAPEDRSWLLSGSSDGGVEVDPVLMAKLAGKDYDPREQRAFIDEDGEARNLDRLDLAGTHYITDNTDEHFNW